MLWHLERAAVADEDVSRSERYRCSSE